jgi:hypothetical protein
MKQITTEKILVLLRSGGKNYPPEVYSLRKLPELLEELLEGEDAQAVQDRSVLEQFDMWMEIVADEESEEESYEMWLMTGDSGIGDNSMQPLTLVEVKEYFGN